MHHYLKSEHDMGMTEKVAASMSDLVRSIVCNVQVPTGGYPAPSVAYAIPGLSKATLEQGCHILVCAACTSGAAAEHTSAPREGEPRICRTYKIGPKP